MKYTVRILILFGVFVASIYFFGSNMDETMFGSVKTTAMAEAELPTMELVADGVRINRLYGFTSALNPYSVREHLVAVEADQTLELLIDEQATDVRKLHYEVLNVDTKAELAEGTINAFDRVEGMKKARIRIEDKMESGQEYAVEVMLVDSESRRIYYYFRVKYYSDSYFAEKTEFMQSFSAWAREKDEEAVIPYLESTYRGEGSTYAQVDIKDSFFMVCWGKLTPKLLTEPELTISEIYSNIAVGTLKYMVELATASGEERYYVTEKFRVIVTKDSKHLLNYERTMEAVFDPSLASISQNQFKLGVTNDTEMELFTNSDSSMLTFVRNKELWHYNLAENHLAKVFSFRNTDEISQGFSSDQYAVRILKLYENGDISFMVHGYMGRGEYEGKTGILLYRYYRGEERMEEQLYLPVGESYQKIKEELGEFSYMNEYDEYFFMVYNTIYSYDLITKELSVIAENTGERDVAFFRESGYVAWQGKEGTGIYLLNMSTGEKQELNAAEGEFIRILGQINENLICGYGHLSELVTLADGSVLYPAYEVKILDISLQEKKSYQKEGTYVSGAEVTPNSIRLLRVEKMSDGEYREIEDDYILNSTPQKKKAVVLEHRITELMFQEYYIDLPSAFKMTAAPVPETVMDTLISEDTTVRVEKLEHTGEEYMVYSFGEIVEISENCATAIQLADQAAVVGTVVDENGRVVWERGIKYSATYLEELNGTSIKNSGLTSKQEAVRMMGDYMELSLDAAAFTEEQTPKMFLEKAAKKRIISLTGVTLDEALYFVYRGAPVFAMKSRTEAVLITGYNAGGITIYDPANGRYKTMPLETAETTFEKAGNIFLSYID